MSAGSGQARGASAASAEAVVWHLEWAPCWGTMPTGSGAGLRRSLAALEC